MTWPRPALSNWTTRNSSRAFSVAMVFVPLNVPPVSVSVCAAVPVADVSLTVRIVFGTTV